jgi:aspartyl/asparaginyl beta-hydroxylase (cupin superfamily)
MSETLQPPKMLEVDRLVGLGRVDAAADLLEHSVMVGELAASPTVWMQVAGMRGALRQPQRALAAVHNALALSPFDFIALVMRASLLEQAKNSQAGLAWSQALARRPAGELPKALAAAVARGELVEQAWVAERDARMTVVTAGALQTAPQETQKRVARFQNNVLRKTRHYHSEPTHFHFPELAEREFHPRKHFAWLTDIEAATDDIRREMQNVLASERSVLVPYVQYDDYQALAQWRQLNGSRDWTAIHLIEKGVVNKTNADQCPITMKLLAIVSQPEISGASPNAMFSLLAPNTAIPPHVGINNTRLVAHLPLVVPRGCWLRVGAETRHWQEGEAFLFDDTIEHEAMNPTDALRVVLIFDVWHPDLVLCERAAVSAIIAAEEGGLDDGL